MKMRRAGHSLSASRSGKPSALGVQQGAPANACLVGAEQWTIAKDRQNETPSLHSFEQDGLRYTWMLEVRAWLYRRRLGPRPTLCFSTAGTCPSRLQIWKSQMPG